MSPVKTAPSDVSATYLAAEETLRKVREYVDCWAIDGDDALHAIGHIKQLMVRRSEAASPVDLCDFHEDQVSQCGACEPRSAEAPPPPWTCPHCDAPREDHDPYAWLCPPRLRRERDQTSTVDGGDTGARSPSLLDSTGVVAGGAVGARPISSDKASAATEEDQ